MTFLSPAIETLPAAWRELLSTPTLATQLQAIDTRLAARAAAGVAIYPPRELIFNALHHVAPQDVRVVILGQDPYHGAGEAMGLSFSVPAGMKIPPSLRNMYKELASDLGIAPAVSGDLSHWAAQGVLLLNTSLTVEADSAGSHGKIGWQAVTDALIDAVSAANPGCVFLLWGNWAQSKAERIDAQRHAVLKAAHPSPLSASRGFFGCRHFSQANQWLAARGRGEIAWGAPAAQDSLF
ncbi:uracil-DNA glycosylase [Vogesella sp. GCM10023246]|uniref:Uracil-DNA glycosylase n=1 Tax=Vogesella oryzagri TaxID=3160864 RepID=A0ABV1M2S6_9NEIS